jgi:hypothetical protein
LKKFVVKIKKSKQGCLLPKDHMCIFVLPNISKIELFFSFSFNIFVQCRNNKENKKFTKYNTYLNILLEEKLPHKQL